MKIALTAPTYWPYGRRGERYINGLGRFLHSQGHEVTIITTKPGPPKEIIRDGLRVLYGSDYSSPLLSYKFRYNMFARTCYQALKQERFDIVQTIFYADTFGASFAKKCSPIKPIFYIPNGVPFHLGGFVSEFMYRRALKSAILLTPSNYLHDVMQENFGVASEVIYPGVDIDYFTPVPQKNLENPKILCMGDLGDPRKRTFLLVKAFEKLKEREPKAILQLSGRTFDSFPEQVSQAVRPEIRKDIQALGVGREEDVPKLYAQAAVTVLPSLYEAFGMVLTESLAAGTPVVGTRDGGIPEIIDNEDVGFLFEGDGLEAIDNLCEALHKAIVLARKAETTTNCRNHSERFSWPTIGGQLENFYKKLLSENP